MAGVSSKIEWMKKKKKKIEWMSELMKCLDYVIDLSPDPAVQSWSRNHSQFKTTMLMLSAPEIVDKITRKK